MVKTRHSVGGDVDDDLSSLDPKASKALQKLKIAGKDALMGDKEKEKKKNVRVYHYRGAVYEVEEGTKAEWVENQPKRYQKRQREAEEGENDAFAGAEDEDEAPRQVKRARKSMPEHAHSNITLSARHQAHKRHSMPSSRTTQPAVPRSARKSAKKPTPAPPRFPHDDDDDDDGLDDDISPVPSQHSPLPDRKQYAHEITQQREMARGREIVIEPYTEQELYNNATASALARLQRNQKAVKVALEQYELARELLERKKREKREREMRQAAVSDEEIGDGSLQTPPGWERVVQESSPQEERDVEMQDDFHDAPEYDREAAGGGLERNEELSHDERAASDEQQPGDQLTEELATNDTPSANAGAPPLFKSPILDPNRHSLDPHDLADEATGPNSYPVGVGDAHDRRASLNPDYARNYRSQTAHSTSVQPQQGPQHPTTTPPRAHARNHSQVSTSPTTTSITGSTTSDSYTAFSNLDPADPLPAEDKGGQRLRWSISIDGPKDDVSNINYTEAAYVWKDVKLPEENKMQKRRRIRREQAVCKGWKRSFGGTIMKENADGSREEWREDGAAGGDGERQVKKARMGESVMDSA